MTARALVLASLVAALAPSVASAQVSGRSDEELRAEGWEFAEERVTPGNVAAGVLALTVGTAWHGAGHGLAGDRGTANRLFAGEGIALVVVGAGFAIRRIADASVVGRSVGTTLQVGGGSLFAASWLADVIGAFKGTGDALPDETSELPGISAEVYYSVLAERGVGFNSLMTVRLPMIADRWMVRPEAQLGLDLEYRRIGAEAGWRIPFGRWRSCVELGGVGFEENAAGYGFGRTSLAGALTVRTDLGDIFEHLGGLMWTNRLEVAVDHQTFAFDGNRRFDPDNRRVHVPVEMALGFNANRNVHVGMGYRHRRDELVGMAGRRVGMFWGRLALYPRNRLGVDIRVEQGAFTRAWFGLQWTLVPGDRLTRADAETDG